MAYLGGAALRTSEEKQKRKGYETKNERKIFHRRKTSRRTKEERLDSQKKNAQKT